jgi:hypothetical protein
VSPPPRPNTGSAPAPQGSLDLAALGYRMVARRRPLRPLRAFGRRPGGTNRLPVTDIWSLYAGSPIVGSICRLFTPAPIALFSFP